jgi:membrane protein implicated in regulation of membrane protease activity
MKWKRPLAMIGLIFILSMYIIAIISAFSHHPESKNWLMAAIFSTVIVPVFLYAVQLVYRVLKPDTGQSQQTKEDMDK